MNCYISIDDFKDLFISQNKSFVLIDVLSSENFEIEHISGSKNICVYEMDFLTKFKGLNLKKSDLIIVYGNSDDTVEVKLAYEKLKANGYNNLFILQDGIRGWKSNKGKIINKRDKNDDKISKIFLQNSMGLDRNLSSLDWKGKNIATTHNGTIDIKEGNIKLKNGKIIGGKIVIDMKTIKDLDLQDEKWKIKLEKHLKSDDFFFVEKYPLAVFEFASVKLQNIFDDRYFDYYIEGNMTIKGQTKKIACYPKVEFLDNGSIHLWVGMVLDRTKWGVYYGSKRFFSKLGSHFVYDNVDLDLNLIFKN